MLRMGSRPREKVMKSLAWAFGTVARWLLKIVFVATLMVGASVATVAIDKAFGLASAIAEMLPIEKPVRQSHRKQLTLAETKVRALEADLLEERQRRDVLGKDIVETRRKVADLEQENTALREGRDQLRGRLREAQAERRVHYRGQQKLVSEAVEDTSRRIADRTVSATGRNIAAMPGEALPWVGLFVVIAATSWELHDACETMKDVAALERAFDPNPEVDPDEVCGMHVPDAETLKQMVKESPEAIWVTLKGEYDTLPEISFSQAWELVGGRIGEIFSKILGGPPE